LSFIYFLLLTKLEYKISQKNLLKLIKFCLLTFFQERVLKIWEKWKFRIESAYIYCKLNPLLYFNSNTIKKLQNEYNRQIIYLNFCLLISFFGQVYPLPPYEKISEVTLEKWNTRETLNTTATLNIWKNTMI